MIKELKERSNIGFEVQWYDDNGYNARVAQCDTVEELAQYLSCCLWGSVKGFKNNPTVWRNGKRWCFGEYTPVESDEDE